jgi:hypothetical protein
MFESNWEYVTTMQKTWHDLVNIDKEKGLLKHNEFSWNFCNCNFESIRIYVKILMNFLIYNIPMKIFQKFEK